VLSCAWKRSSENRGQTTFRHTSTDGEVSSVSVDISHENLLTEVNKYENCRPYHFITEEVCINTNGKDIPVHAVKTHGASTGIAPAILNLNNKCT
jgi:hypothetical protein